MFIKYISHSRIESVKVSEGIIKITVNSKSANIGREIYETTEYTSDEKGIHGEFNY